MNDVTISGILDGNLEDYANDGAMFNVLVSSGDNSDRFTCLAFGNTASLLRAKANSGDRLVMQGRLSGEKLGTEKYHTAVSVSRVLAITASENGIDAAQIVVSGDTEVKDLINVGAKDTSLVPLRMVNYRYFTRDGKTDTYKTYLGASVWAERAEALNSAIGAGQFNLIVSGFLRARTYEDRDGDTIGTVDVWVQDVYGGEPYTTPEGAEGSTAGAAPAAAAPSTPRSEPPYARKSAVDDDLPF